MRLKRFLLAGLLPVLAVMTLAQSHIKLAPEYRHWLDEDVRWIISPQELKQFLQLPNDPARDRFVMEFWERRNPTPGTKENAFKTEHYRRLEFVNEHFAAKLPGWLTDRGRIYILHGAPDSITAHAFSGHPGEIWIYRQLNGERNVSFRFVDQCACGDYRFIPDGTSRPAPLFER